jgi:hypothetical protein
MNAESSVFEYSSFDGEAARSEAMIRLRGLADHFEKEDPAMHKTNTIGTTPATIVLSRAQDALCCTRDIFIERLKRHAPGISIMPRPNWRQVPRDNNFALQRLGFIRSRNAPRHFAMFGGKGALQSMDNFFQAGNIGFVFHRRTMQKPRGSQPLDRCMNFRRAEAEDSCAPTKLGSVVSC